MSILNSITIFAQTTGPSFSSDPFNHPLFPLYVASALVFVALILVMAVAVMLLRAVNTIVEETERRKALEEGKVYVPRETWLSRISQSLNASVPVSEEKEIELDHNYDGIKELDNHLPPWWKWLFYGTIGWSAIYLVMFHLSSSLPLSEEEYLTELANAQEQIRLYQASQPQAAIDVESLSYKHDEGIIAKGREIFTNMNCGSCHRNDGGGNTIGPNLTDEYWLHGGDVKAIFKTIKSGVIEKGMPEWGRSLSPAQMRDLSFYILSLQGSNPANAKSAQGELYKEVLSGADSTRVTTAF